jgi:hypothetical protein
MTSRNGVFTLQAGFSNTWRKARFSSPARSGQSLECFAKRRCPPKWVKAAWRDSRSGAKISQIFGRSLTGRPVPKPNPLYPLNPSKPLRQSGAPVVMRGSGFRSRANSFYPSIFVKDTQMVHYQAPIRGGIWPVHSLLPMRPSFDRFWWHSRFICSYP